MIYPALKIHPHFLHRFTQRLKIRLSDTPSINGVIKRIQNESFHMTYIGNREMRLFRIKKRFYIGIISQQDETVLTIYHPNNEKREFAFYTFERADHSDTDQKTLMRYNNWRKNLLQGTGWVTNRLPTDNAYRHVVAWGNYKTHAWYDHNEDRWIDEQGHTFSTRDIWGWRHE